MGLYISYQIVVQHRGRMWLESQVGEGTTFYFSIPLEIESLDHTEGSVLE
ncbi:MAG: ATP-binding protein [Chloroflexota bacterium]